MSRLLRLLQLLAMVVWVGGLLFFAFVLAPVAFHTLPIRQAGLVVGGALKVFHPVGLVCGVLFSLATAGLLFRSARGRSGRLWSELALTGAMLLTTLYLKQSVLPAMDQDQARAAGDVNAVSVTDPARVEFDRLHVLSERLEGAVLLCGLGVIGLLAD